MGSAAKLVNGVRIRSLTVSGFKKNGIWASRTDRLNVQRVVAEKNGVWGIAQERSTRAVFRHNAARDNGDVRHLPRERRRRGGRGHRHPWRGDPRQPR